MENRTTITAQDCCLHYNIDYSFINLLHQHGLLEVTDIDHNGLIPFYELQKLERLIRLHYELEINVEGIEAIFHLLEKVDQMQAEVIQLQNRLRRFEY